LPAHVHSRKFVHRKNIEDGADLVALTQRAVRKASAQLSDAG